MQCTTTSLRHFDVQLNNYQENPTTYKINFIGSRILPMVVQLHIKVK